MSSIRQKTETIQPVIIGLKARLSIRELTSASALALIVFTMSWAANGVSGDTLWSAHVEPLLKEHCAECHNPTKAKSGLDLTSLQAILRGGERGAAVIPGRPDDSHIYTALFAGADPHMPPGNRKKLSDEEAALIRRWIEKLGTANTQNVTNWSETTYASVAVKRRITWEPPADMPASKAVDRFLELAWKLEKVTPAARASDRAFVRRVHLDLIGRVPTREQTEDFLADRRRDKRARLIDALLANDDYARHMREIFDPVLMERRDSKWEEQREKQKWFGWIEDQFKRNRPWNEVVRDVIVARPTQPEDRGAVWFLYERENNPQAVAEALAPIVLVCR